MSSVGASRRFEAVDDIEEAEVVGSNDAGEAAEENDGNEWKTLNDDTGAYRLQADALLPKK